MAACLFVGEGAAISHESAAELMGLMKRSPVAQIHVCVPRGGRKAAEGLVVHNVRDLEPVDIITYKEILPVTNATRLLIDLAETLSVEELEVMLDQALWKGMTKIPRLKWRINTIGHGRGGILALRDLIEERVGQPISQSPLETKFVRLLRNSGLRMPSRQFEVRVAGKRRYIDFAYAETKIAIELDGKGSHGPTSFQDDRDRQNALINLGWRVLRFTWDDVTTQSEKVLRLVAEALAKRKASTG